jgi:hypothetical protein
MMSGVGWLYSLDCRERKFSETRIQPSVSLCVRIGDMRSFAPVEYPRSRHLDKRLDRYSRYPKEPTPPTGAALYRLLLLWGYMCSHYPTAPKASGGILVALRELQYYLVSCIPAQFYLFGARRRRDSYLLGLLRLFLRLFLPKLSAIRVARFNSPRY